MLVHGQPRDDLRGRGRQDDAVPDPGPDARVHADGGAHERQRPRPGSRPSLQAEFLAYDCANPDNDPANAPKDQPLITCDPDGTAKYILGPVELDGSAIDDATFGLTRRRTASGPCSSTFDGDGTETFGEVSRVCYGADAAAATSSRSCSTAACISAPSMNGVILDGDPSISGSFTQETREDPRRPAEVRCAAAELRGA